MNITAEEVMNIVYRSFYSVNAATIQSGMDEKTLRAVRKGWNDLIDEINKNALASAGTLNKGVDKYSNHILTPEKEVGNGWCIAEG